MGYALARRVDLPPLMFDREELQALALGLRFVVAEGDPAVRQAAERALAKLRATLPREQSLRLAESPVYVPRRRPETAARLAELVAAVEARDVLRLTYADERGATTVRNVRPLGALYGVAAWSLVAWCELREAHRTFRLDRIHGVTKTGRRFHPEVGRGLQDFFQALQADYGIPTAHFDPEG
jgi:predicted DNA-binding transcriptional regulator YafY